MPKIKKRIFYFALVLFFAAGIFFSYQKYFSPTKIALVNFPNFQAAGMAKSNDSRFIKIKEVGLDDIDKLKQYDAVLIFAMGIDLNEAQRERIQKYAASGLRVYSTAATNPDNNICSLDSVQSDAVKAYLGYGGKQNYRRLFHYIRRVLDHKTAFTPPVEGAVETPSDVLYYLEEEQYFTSVKEYERFYQSKKQINPHAPKVAIISTVAGAFTGNREHIDSLIIRLESANYQVYPISAFQKRLTFLQEINPDIVIYMPHGRLMMGGGDQVVEWLKQRNIPVFCPITILHPEKEWLEDKMGMAGGFLSQSVVMPELDGGIIPYVLNAQYMDKDGFYLFKTIPDRLTNFIKIMDHYMVLRQKPNNQKKIAIYYFKGPGQHTLQAAGMETVPSLYNLLKRLQREGYLVKNLPATVTEFEKLLMTQGAVLGTYAEGAFDQYLHTGHPALVEKSTYEQWVAKTLPSEKYKEVVAQYGEAPGNYMSVEQKGKNYLAVARIELGNIVLLPQPMPGLGENTFQLVHGSKSAPQHTYIASYLWTQHAFKADALIHFGTHGSLEFTPEKQIALSAYDWPDRLIGTLPHFYIYTIANVGEGIIAKRRSYATLVSYLTAPFMESKTRGQYQALQQKIAAYHRDQDEMKPANALAVKKLTIALGIHRDLKLDSNLSKPYHDEEIERIENFAEEIANERMQGAPYVLNVPYQEAQIHSTVMAMCADPIAYSLAALDRQRGKVTDVQLRNQTFFTEHYLSPAKKLVNQLLKGKKIDDEWMASLTGISPEQLHQFKEMSSMTAMGMRRKAVNAQDNKERMKMPASGETRKIEKPEKRNENTDKAQKALMACVMEVDRTVNNVENYKLALKQSPEIEMQSLINALNGGYVAPSPGGDPVANPNTLPTGRNLYSINAEATPSQKSWDKGVELAKQTLEQYYKKHGKYPQKVSYTFWSGEFIETEGATIAQVLYMLGVEPVWDAFGRVNDIRLIPSAQLGRPRIDVLVQTSGQFRDLAASRLFLLQRAIDMASGAGNESHPNFVSFGTKTVEKELVEQGVSPKEAREMSTARIFGGVNGGYGTGITGMVESGSRWDKEEEIANVYLNNMGAMYGNEKAWGKYTTALFAAAMKHTDAVVQPRQSNTWGALSLDHVYEFMGGLNLAVRQVTGKDPETYFSDYRNRNKAKIQDLKEAVGIEARTTLFNPEYIKEQMKGGASAANGFAEMIRNTYGWNVMKPDLIDQEMWNAIYDVYVKDQMHLGIHEFFKDKNPAALQEMTAVMLETSRKGYWKASETQLKDIANLHQQLIKAFHPACSGFVCDNAKLQQYISSQLSEADAKAYQQQINQVREAQTTINQKGTVMKKEDISQTPPSRRQTVRGVTVGVIALLAFAGLFIYVRKKKK